MKLLLKLTKYLKLQLKIFSRNIERSSVITCREAPSHPTERGATDDTIFIDDDDSTSETEDETLNEMVQGRMALEMTTMSVADTREEDARRMNEVNQFRKT